MVDKVNGTGHEPADFRPQEEQSRSEIDKLISYIIKLSDDLPPSEISFTAKEIKLAKPLIKIEGKKPLTKEEENDLVNSILDENGILHKILMVDKTFRTGIDKIDICPLETLKELSNSSGKEPYPPLSIAEKFAIFIYSAFAFRIMNGLLDLDMTNLNVFFQMRSFTNGESDFEKYDFSSFEQLHESDQEYLAEISVHIEKLIRAMNSGLEKLDLPDVDVVYRGDAIREDELFKYKEGYRFSREKFLSFSSDESEAIDFAEDNASDYNNLDYNQGDSEFEFKEVVFVVENPLRAKSIKLIANDPDEEEYLYTTGSNFEVTDIIRDSYLYYIILKEVI